MNDETANNPIEELAPEEPRGRGREKGFVMPQSHRDKIKNSNILSCLIAHVVEGREMNPSQVTAGLGLLKKVFPDLSAVAHSGDEDNPVAHLHTIELRPLKPVDDSQGD